jgi:hypothetical protein
MHNGNFAFTNKTAEGAEKNAEKRMYTEAFP